MARAAKLCTVPGCPNFADCSDHPVIRISGWASSTHTKPPGWRRTWRRVMVRDHHRCRICGQRAFVVDHWLPQAWGGDDTLANLRAMCHRCHLSKTTAERLLGKRRKAHQLEGDWPAQLRAFLEQWEA
jgi:5-methylcytosine-specific restriction protein A